MLSTIKTTGNYKTDIKTIAGIVLGLVFVFSGFVKIIDPVNTRETFEDYLGEMLNLKQYIDGNIIYLISGILFSAFEFTLGVALIIRFKPVLTSWISLLLMSFFTALTLLLATTDILPHCGCMGAAIELSNWETFFKNLVIMVPTVFYFICRHEFSKKNTNTGDWLVLILGFLLMISISIIKFYS